MAQLRSINRVVGIFVLLSVLFTPPAEAQAAPCVSYWAAAAVFVGRVEAIKRVGTSRVVSFAVLEGFAGVRTSTIEVSTGPAGQRCSFSPAIGKDYIVYADRSESGGLTTSRCSGTRDVEDAGSDLAYAREVKQGKAPAGYIAGRVLTATRDLAGKTTGVPQPAEGISVTVTRDGLTDILTTDRAGDFRMREPRPWRLSHQRERAGTVLLGRRVDDRDVARSARLRRRRLHPPRQRPGRRPGRRQQRAGRLRD